MINETYKNVLFGIASMSMMLASIAHSKSIADNLQMAEEYYFLFNFGVVITCLFANICLGIFSFFILGNLNDFIHKMCLNLVGACQKLRVLAFLMVINTSIYIFSNLLCFFHSLCLSNIEKNMAQISAINVILQTLHIYSIHLLHPDILGIKWLRKIKEYDRGNHSNYYYL